MDLQLRVSDAPTESRFDNALAVEPFHNLTAYRPFIDGLRAVSILAVVLCHVGVPGVSGGYVGVDVFFVISGFLIISQISEAVQGGRFSFGQFWSRRALRILPPYLLVMAFCMAVAPFVLVMPDELQQFAKEVSHGAAMVINHLFLIQQGYFDTASETKVLLHLWSLAVEEQFYFVAPCIIVGVWWLAWRLKPQQLAPVLIATNAVIFAASLAGCILLTVPAGGRNYAFYLTALRAWEFVAGGSIAFLLPAVYRLPWQISSSLSMAGLAAIIFAAFSYTIDTPYPSWRATVPVFGALAVILGGLASAKSGTIRLLSSRPMVAIGLISYSWYLWHWPLLAFSRILQFGERNFVTDFALGLLSLGLAAATFFLVEQPIRRWRQTRMVPFGWRPVFVGIAICATISIGGSSSFDAAGKHIATTAESQYLPVSAKPAGFCDLASATSQDCLDLAYGRPIGLLMGDSHAGHARNRLAAFAERHETLLASFVSPGCMTFSGMKLFIGDPANRLTCMNLEKKEASLPTVKPAYALLFARWPLYGTPKYGYHLGLVDADEPAVDQGKAFISGLRNTVARLRSIGVERVLVVGPTPVFPRKAPSCLYLADRYGRNRDKECGIDRAVAEEERRIAGTWLMTSIADFPGLRYIDPFASFCNDPFCLPYSDVGVLFTDDNHLSDAGMDRLIATYQTDFEWLVAAKSSSIATEL